MGYHPKKEILEKPIWTIADIMRWCGCGHNKASQILKTAKSKGGAVPLGAKYATSNSVLALFGTSRKEELEVLDKCGT